MLKVSVNILTMHEYMTQESHKQCSKLIHSYFSLYYSFSYLDIEHNINSYSIIAAINYIFS